METPQQAWMRRAYEARKVALAKHHARQNPEPPDTPESRAEKEAIKARWMKRHKVKKCPPAFASFVGFERPR